MHFRHTSFHQQDKGGLMTFLIENPLVFILILDGIYIQQKKQTEFKPLRKGGANKDIL